MELGLQGKTAIVTGGSGAIGSGIAKILASEGVTIMLSYFSNNSKAVETALCIERNGGRAFTNYLDVRDVSSVSSFFHIADESLRGIDILINCAGAAFFEATENYEEEEWNRIIDTNLKGTFLCCREVIKYFLKRGEGDIVNISSLAAEIGSFEGASYAASKAGVNQLTRSLALELADKNIRVNGVAPGRITTPFRRTTSGEYYEFMLKQTPLKRMGTVDEIARAVAFIASRACAFMTGETIYVTGGLHTVYLGHVNPDPNSVLRGSLPK